MSHGVRKVNEYLVRDGRALIMTQDVAVGITQAQWDSIADGTLYINPDSGVFRYKNRNSNLRDWDVFNPENMFNQGSISNYLMGANSVGNEQLIEGSVSTEKVKDEAITGGTHLSKGKIAERTLTDYNIAYDVIRGGKAPNEGNIAEKTIESYNIAFETITGGTSEEKGNLASKTVRAYNLADGAVSVDKLASNAVTTIKIKDLQITGWSSDNNQGKIALGTITEKNIADNAVTAEKIAYDTVTGGEDRGLGNIAESTICAYNINKNAVTTAKIKDENVTGGDAANKGKIAPRTITEYNVAFDTITGGEGAEQGNIAAETIRGYNIAPNTITNDLLDESLRKVMAHAVVHDPKDPNYTATVQGDLLVEKNIRSSSSTKAYSVTGFKVFNPVFADYAEGFVASEPLEVGDIVEIDRYGCVKKADSHSRKIVGVVSDRYGMCLDADEDELSSGSKVAVGLLGKVPVNVAGKVQAGDFIVSSGDGVGMVTRTYSPGTIVGKALEDKDTYGLGQVLCLINPM